jgi:hypothetical protein
MAYFSWLEQQRALSAVALTIRAQTVSPNDLGRLKWDAYFPLRNADSTKLSDLLTSDWRPVADRREWNTRGRHIPVKTPDRLDIEFTPIESYFKIEEKEINDLMNRFAGNQQLFQRAVGVSIPERTDGLAGANYRRLEVDAFSAWALGQIVIKNPQIGGTKTVSLGFAAARYVTAGTAWNNGAVNAYDELLLFVRAATDLIGSVGGVMMRLATWLEIQKDAPNPLSATVKATQAQVEERIQDELKIPFEVIVNEDSQDIFTDGGNDTTRVKVWPAQRVAAIPQGEKVGVTHRAPVARAWDLANAEPDAGIDVRGMTVFNEIGGAGRDLTVECQGNYLAVPNEQLMYVANVGV